MNLLAVAVLLAVLQKHLEIELRMGLIQILDHLQWIAEELMKMQQCLNSEQSRPGLQAVKRINIVKQCFLDS